MTDDETLAPPSNVATDKTFAATDKSNVATDRTAPATGVALDRTQASTSPNSSPDAYRELPAVDRAHYIVKRELAHGGMGRIVIAHDRRLDRTVALKEMLVVDDGMRLRFEREVRITARLQHPNIVSIHEAGTWPNGEPFFAMKLIPGRSLEDVIATTSDLDRRLALLPAVIATCDALAYAHDQRVIHRDLKPANVLVGDFGETIVIDWGIAKFLDTADQVEDDSTQPIGGETVVGAIIGTLAYMAPEQARGEPVDERGDVYGLGAILYQLLAGRSPYRATTSPELLEKVLKGSPEPVTQLAPGVPRDLVAIVEKAMSRSAEDRYRSARELAADLKSFQTGRLVGAHEYSRTQLLRRWIRRHRTALAITSIAVVVLAIVGVLSIRQILAEQRATKAEHRVAENHRRDAEALIEYMLGDLRTKLEPLNQVGLLDSVAQRALKYYEDIPPTAPTTDQSRKALALEQLSGVFFAQGKLDDALAQSRAALEVRRAMAAREPDNAELEAKTATSWAALGFVLVAQSKLDDATAAYENARTIQTKLRTANPTNAKLTIALVDTELRLGEIRLSKGNATEAVALANHARALAEALPPADDRTTSLIDIHQMLAKSLGEHDPVASLGHARTALELARSLADAEPRDPIRAKRVARQHSSVARRLTENQQAAEAIEHQRKAVAIFERLAAEDGSNLDLQHDLANSLGNLGRALAQTAPDEMLSVDRRALAILEALIVKDATNAVWLSDLITVRDNVATVLINLGKFDQSLVELAANATLDERRRKLDPENVAYMRGSWLLHLKLSVLKAQLGDAKGELEEAEKMLAIVQVLRKRDPDNLQWMEDEGRSYLKLGLARESQPNAKLEDVHADLRRGVEINELLVRRAMTINNLTQLEMAYRTNGIVLSDTRVADARVQFEKAIATTKQLVEKAPDEPRWKKQLEANEALLKALPQAK